MGLVARGIDGFVRSESLHSHRRSLHKTWFKDLACPQRRTPIDLSLPPLNPHDITYAKSAHPSPITARTSRVFVLIQFTRASTWSSLLDLLVRVRHFDDRGTLESFHKSRTTRLGIDYSNSKHLLLVQDRGPTWLVGNLDVDSNRKSNHLDHPLHRLGKKLRKGRRFWNWFAFAAVYFLSNPRLWQRPVPSAIGIIWDGCCSATAACLGTNSRAAVFNPPSTLHKVERVVPNTLTGPRS